MFRFVQSACLVLLYAFVVSVAPLMAAEPFGLPACAADFRNEVVLNSGVLDAMITQAEPTGARPDDDSAMLLIMVRHYLAQRDGLLVLSRTAPLRQEPLLLQNDCLPYPAAAQETRLPLTDLSTEQKQTLVTYYNLVEPAIRETRTPAPADTMAPIPTIPTPGAEAPPVVTPTIAIDIYEVTNEQYKQFIDAKGYETQTYWTEEGWGWVQSSNRRQPSYWDHDELNQPDQPVVGVTWYEADAYCRWSGKTLPTEEQWENACGGTDKRTYPWGNEPLTPEEPAEKAASPETQPLPAVGSAPHTQSPDGVHDLAGSVLEWTSTVRADGGVVLRGGSGPSTSPRVGCYVSHTLLPGMSANFIGFRCQAETTAAQ